MEVRHEALCDDRRKEKGANALVSHISFSSSVEILFLHHNKQHHIHTKYVLKLHSLESEGVW